MFQSIGKKHVAILQSIFNIKVYKITYPEHSMHSIFWVVDKESMYIQPINILYQI